MSSVFERVVESKPLQAITSLGLGVVIAWFAFSHFLSQDKAQDEFMRDTFVDMMQKDIEAQTQNTAAQEKVATAMLRVIEEFDDLSDTNREVVRRFDRMYPALAPPTPAGD